MKLIIAIIQNDDERSLLNKLMKEGFRATKLASTGGFLRTGNTTLMLGVEDDRLDEALNLLRETCKTRKITLPSYPYAMETWHARGVPGGDKGRGATIFVVPVEQKLNL